jgi:LysR family transcriptional regulator, hydrogen peroxide-inducible genes activator
VDLTSVTLTQLRYAVALDRWRSFRVAARRVNVSQPALSMQVSKLEETLGVHVFDRSKNPVVPTAHGERVLAHARKLLRECERLGEIANETESVAGVYRLGVIPTLAPTLLPRLLPAFSKEHPDVELVVEEVQTDALIQRLRDDTLDGGLAVTPLGVPGLHERVIQREAFFVYLSPKHALRGKKRIKQSDLVDSEVWLMPEGHCFRSQVLQLCKVDRRSEAESRSLRFESGSLETLVRLVDAGLGATILPALVVEMLPERKRKGQVRPFERPVPVREISFVRLREHLRRGVADAIADMLAEALARPKAPKGAEKVVVPVVEEL